MVEARGAERAAPGGQSWASLAVCRPPDSKESRPQPILCQGDMGKGNFGTCAPKGFSDPFSESSAFPEDPQALLGMSRPP